MWGLIFVFNLVIWFGSELRDIRTIAALPRQSSIEILDTKNRHIASYGHFQRSEINAKEVPPHLINALISIEDRRFYKHFGIDPIAIARALKENLERGCIAQGGSTITQQLAKNMLQQKKIFDYRDRSLKRKIMEAILAIKIERTFSKEKILEMHLNRAYMGSGTWGLKAAAFKYFGRSVKDINLYESCILVGLLQAPSFYSPAKSQAQSEQRAQRVLDAMVESGFINTDVSKATMAMPSSLAKENYQYSARYFSDWIMDELYVQGILDTEKDLVVKTTLNLDIQKIADLRSKKIMKQYGPKWKAEQMALVSMTPHGAVRAMIGGIDYTSSPFNRATKSLRQTGSAFKYFVFLAALLEGWCPESMISDEPITIGNWTAKNFKLYKPRGHITLRTAFAQSVNTSTIRLAQSIGIKKIISLMRELGITAPIPPSAHNLTLAIGTLNLSILEMTSAFAAMINDGTRVTPYGIKKIKSSDGKTIYCYNNVDCAKKIDPEAVKEMRSLLQSVMDSGTGRRAKIEGMWCGGKSGTSNTGEYDRDLWFVGLTDDLCTAVWCGCDKEEPMHHQAGGSPALHIWKEFNQALIKKRRSS